MSLRDQPRGGPVGGSAPDRKQDREEDARSCNARQERLAEPRASAIPQEARACGKLDGTMSANAAPGAGGELEQLARQALEGNRAALERIVVALQADLFALALRMLGRREDAEDATQEILVRVVTRLSQFDFRSQLKTWAWRIAINYILDFKKSAEEKQRRTFVQLGEELAAGLRSDTPPETERSLLVEEIRIACTLGMLQCLDKPLRAAFILGEIMELSGPEAAEILQVSPALFRKRLQQARTSMTEFLQRHCGLVSDQAPCRCHLHASAHTPAPAPPRLAAREISFAEARATVRRVEQARWALQVHRSAHPFTLTADFARRVMAALDLHLDQAAGI